MLLAWLVGMIVSATFSLCAVAMGLIGISDSYGRIAKRDNARMTLKAIGSIVFAPFWPALVVVLTFMGMSALLRVAEIPTPGERIAARKLEREETKKLERLERQRRTEELERELLP